MVDDLRRRLDELQDCIDKASLNHDIWRVYKVEREKYIEVMNNDDYLLFFKTSIHAHFVACVMALYRMCETRDDTHNLPSFLKILETDLIFPKDKLELVKNLYEQAKPIWIKINIVRNKVFGHRNLEFSTEEAFAQASLKVDDFEKIISLLKELINTVYYYRYHIIMTYLKSDSYLRNVLDRLKML